MTDFNILPTEFSEENGFLFQNWAMRKVLQRWGPSSSGELTGERKYLAVRTTNFHNE